MSHETNQRRVPPDVMHWEHSISPVFLLNLNLITRADILPNNWPVILKKVVAHEWEKKERKQKEV